MDIPILFENESFLIVDKPPCVLSVFGREGEKDPRPCVLSILRETKSSNLLPVHRLDFEVSGVLLIAKSTQSHRIANGWFENRTVKKYYEAWTEGTKPISSNPERWVSKILRGKKRAYESPVGKDSETIATWKSELLIHGQDLIQQWELQPLTGRSHQLRFELAKHGYPILGDHLYGSKRDFGNGIGLRSILLDFRGCPESNNLGLPEQVVGVSIQKKFGI